MKNKCLSIRTDQEILDRLDAIVNYANENLLPGQKKVNKTTIIESLITFAYVTGPKEDEGETLVGMSQETEDERIERLYSINEAERGQYEKGND